MDERKEVNHLSQYFEAPSVPYDEDEPSPISDVHLIKHVDDLANTADGNIGQVAWAESLADTNPFRSSDSIKILGEASSKEFKVEAELEELNILQKTPSKINLSENYVIDVSEVNPAGEEKTDNIGLELGRLSVQVEDLVEKAVNMSQSEIKDTDAADIDTADNKIILVKHEPVDDVDVHNIIEAMGTLHSNVENYIDEYQPCGQNLSPKQRLLIEKGKEKVELWQKEFDQKLLTKDEEEKNKIMELQTIAHKQLLDWSQEYHHQLDQTREINRSRNDDASPVGNNGTSPNWDRIAELCDFNNRIVGGKSNPRLKFLSRMKNVIESLQKTPLPSPISSQSSSDKAIPPLDE